MERMRLSAWRFAPDPFESGERQGFFEPAMEDSHWTPVQVPCVFDHCLPCLAFYEGAGWFRCRAEVPPEWSKRRVVLRFGAVNYHAKVWANGHLIGENMDGFLPFEIPLDCSQLQTGELVLAVLADNRRRMGEVPGIERGWRPSGGILREVELIADDPLRIETMRVTAEPDGRFQALVEMANGRETAVELLLSFTVADREGKPLAQLQSVPTRIESGQSLPILLTGEAAGARPWSPQSPTLYLATAEIRVQEAVVSSRSARIGFRRIEARGTRLYLNGEEIRLKGFNRHEDTERSAMCVDRAAARQDLQQILLLGGNFVRLCHYPHDPSTLDLCDELGLLVMAEIPLYWWNGLKEGEENCARKREAAKRQLTALIARDGSHPSVIFWSVSNETHENLPEVAAGNRELVELAQRLDPTRLAVHVSDHWHDAVRFDADDVICLNGYPAWGAKAWQGKPLEPLSSAQTWWRQSLQRVRAAYPEKPILITEFGHPGLAGAADGTGSEAAQAEVIAAEGAALLESDVCGVTLWCYADHAWPDDVWMNRLVTSPFGVVTRDRKPKPAMETVRALYGGRPDPAVANTQVVMVRSDMRNIPQFALPAGCVIRGMKPGEIGLWTDVQRDAEPFFSIADELFVSQFGQDFLMIEDRCYLVFDPQGRAVATISAWFHPDFEGEDYGRIHWVATRPAWQGRGIAKGMMTHAMNRLAQSHRRAYLDTSIGRHGAIRIYLDFGFRPHIQTEADREAWQSLAILLRHPLLDAALL
jgi:beta-glucuronidase